MATLGWLGWRSIWAPPKGGEAATVPCNSYGFIPMYRLRIISLRESCSPNQISHRLAHEQIKSGKLVTVKIINGILAYCGISITGDVLEPRLKLMVLIKTVN